MAQPLLLRLLRAWGGIRASFRAELASGVPESRLLFLVMAACAVLYAARLPALMQAAPAELRAGDGLAAYAGSLFVAHVFFAPLMLYGLAALSRLGARAAGGAGSWHGARLALFWPLLVTMPATVAVSGLVTLAGLGMTGAGALLGSLPALAFLGFWAVCLAESEGFRRVLPVLACLVAVPAVIAGLSVLARSVG